MRQRPITVTAYDPADIFETKAIPCIGAANIDICKRAETEIVFAANFVPLHTKICVDTIGCGEVLDHMNKRFNNRIDYAVYPGHTQEAKQFGIKKLNYYCE